MLFDSKSFFFGLLLLFFNSNESNSKTCSKQSMAIFSEFFLLSSTDNDRKCCKIDCPFISPMSQKFIQLEVLVSRGLVSNLEAALLLAFALILSFSNSSLDVIVLTFLLERSRGKGAFFQFKVLSPGIRLRGSTPIDSVYSINFLCRLRLKNGFLQLPSIFFAIVKFGTCDHFSLVNLWK
eukprot:NODE_85_length_22232_cov_1.318619.p17 type:complete len:180 gc:universal NODE_85_length_22232_cov_1.318619:9915-10454(+)